MLKVFGLIFEIGLDDPRVIGIIVIVVLTLLVGVWYLDIELPRREKKEREREKKESTRQELLRLLEERVHNAFSFELDTIHESDTQDEIVRVVNLLARRTAEACFNQETTTDSCSDYEVGCLKRRWSDTRKLALQIAPQLADRMPHFSDFEPLKSYREEHLQEKAKKQSVV